MIKGHQWAQAMVELNVFDLSPRFTILSLGLIFGIGSTVHTFRRQRIILMGSVPNYNENINYISTADHQIRSSHHTLLKIEIIDMGQGRHPLFWYIFSRYIFYTATIKLRVYSIRHSICKTSNYFRRPH